MNSDPFCVQVDGVEVTTPWVEAENPDKLSVTLSDPKQNKLQLQTGELSEYARHKAH